MREMKTAQLIGPALDWAVAKIEGYQCYINHDAFGPGEHEVVYVNGETGDWHHNGNWRASTNWSQGGPLIEKHDINTIRCNDLYFPKGNEHGDFYEPYWEATIDGGTDAGIPLYKTYGPTPLIAAMRCLVDAKLGDTVQIPSELIQ